MRPGPVEALQFCFVVLSHLADGADGSLPAALRSSSMISPHWAPSERCSRPERRRHRPIMPARPTPDDANISSPVYDNGEIEGDFKPE